MVYDGELTRIPSALVAPKPARPIPMLPAAGNERAQRRLVDHADGRLPPAVWVEQTAAQWRELREPAAERGRTAPIRTTLRTNPRYTPKPYEGDDRAPFQGSVRQIVEDLGAYAEIGFDEIIVDFQEGARDVQELKDVAAEVYEMARAAGV